MNLHDVAKRIWQAPATDSFRSRGGDRKDEMGLDQQARNLWAAPASSLANYDEPPESFKARGEALKKRGYPAQGVNLSQQSSTFQSPLPALQTPPDGVPSSEWRPTSRRLFRSATLHVKPRHIRRWLKRGNWRKRRLNPLFVEWLMLWPAGHALCDSWETELFLWRLRMLTVLSRLPLAYAQWIWKPSLRKSSESDQLTLL